MQSAAVHILMRSWQSSMPQYRALALLLTQLEMLKAAGKMSVGMYT